MSLSKNNHWEQLISESSCHFQPQVPQAWRLGTSFGISWWIKERQESAPHNNTLPQSILNHPRLIPVGPNNTAPHPVAKMCLDDVWRWKEKNEQKMGWKPERDIKMSGNFFPFGMLFVLHMRVVSSSVTHGWTSCLIQVYMPPTVHLLLSESCFTQTSTSEDFQFISSHQGNYFKVMVWKTASNDTETSF